MDEAHIAARLDFAISDVVDDSGKSLLLVNSFTANARGRLSDERFIKHLLIGSII